jgi:hypothetical protein
MSIIISYLNDLLTHSKYFQHFVALMHYIEKDFVAVITLANSPFKWKKRMLNSIICKTSLTKCVQLVTITNWHIIEA